MCGVMTGSAIAIPVREWSELASQMEDAGKRGGLTVLCGAGVSMQPPSLLPSGSELLVDALRRCVGDLRLGPDLDRITARSDLATLIPELVVQRILDITGSVPSGIYEPFRIVEPNQLHRFLGSLTTRGGTVLTTNFDECVELHGDRTRIVHLHGQISDPSSLAHTIRLVGQGRPSAEVAWIRELVRGSDLYVLGYSGNDMDVMQLLQSCTPKSITWAVRDPNDRACANLAHFKFPVTVEVVQADLAGSAPGAPLTTPERGGSIMRSRRESAASADLPLSKQTEVLIGVYLQLQDYRSAADLASRFDQLDNDAHAGASVRALRVFALRRLGRVDEAIRLGTSLLPWVGHVPPLLGSRIETELALAYLDEDPPCIDVAGELISSAEARLSQELERIAREPGREREVEHYRANRASAIHNIGWVREQAGDFAGAAVAYRRALRAKKAIGDLPSQITSERDVALMSRLLGKKHAAGTHFRRFELLCEQYGEKYEYAYYFTQLASHLIALRRNGEAVEAARQAVAACDSLGVEESLRRRAQELLAQAVHVFGDAQQA